MGTVDANEQEINIGDKVATTQWIWWKRKTSSDLMTAKVTGFTKKKVKLEYFDDGETYTTTKFPSQIAVIERGVSGDAVSIEEISNLRSAAFNKWQETKSEVAGKDFDVLDRYMIITEQIGRLRQRYGEKGKCDDCSECEGNTCRG